MNKILYKLVQNPQGNYYEFSTDKKETLYNVSFNLFWNWKRRYKLKQSTNNGRVFEFVGAGNGDYSALRKLPSPQKSQVFLQVQNILWERKKIGGDFSLSNYDINLFSSKQRPKYRFCRKNFRNKIFTKTIGGTLGAEFQRISSQFHILDRINDVEFSRDFNLTQEFNQITQNRLIFSFKQLENTNFINYKLNYLNEKQS